MILSNQKRDAHFEKEQISHLILMEKNVIRMCYYQKRIMLHYLVNKNPLIY